MEDPARPGIFNESVSSSFAKDINEDGVVVGSAGLRSVPGFTKPSHNAWGWMWTKDGGLVWLNDLIDPALGIDIISGINITDDGRILAGGYVAGSTEFQYFLLTVPEPSTAGLLILSCLVFARRRR